MSITLRNGQIIDFDGTDWQIKMDTTNNQVSVVNTATGNKFSFTSNGVFDVPDGYSFGQSVAIDEITANKEFHNAVYQSESDLPSSPPEGSQAYVIDTASLYIFN